MAKLIGAVEFECLCVCVLYSTRVTNSKSLPPFFFVLCLSVLFVSRSHRRGNQSTLLGLEVF